MFSSRFLLLTISLTLMIILGDNGSNAAEEDDFTPAVPLKYKPPKPAPILRSENAFLNKSLPIHRTPSSHTTSSLQTQRSSQPDPGVVESSCSPKSSNLASLPQLPSEMPPLATIISYPPPQNNRSSARKNRAANAPAKTATSSSSRLSSDNRSASNREKNSVANEGLVAMVDLAPANGMSQEGKRSALADNANIFAANEKFSSPNKDNTATAISHSSNEIVLVSDDESADETNAESLWSGLIGKRSSLLFWTKASEKRIQTIIDTRVSSNNLTCETLKKILFDVFEALEQQSLMSDQFNEQLVSCKIDLISREKIEKIFNKADTICLIGGTDKQHKKFKEEKDRQNKLGKKDRGKASCISSGMLPSTGWGRNEISIKNMIIKKLKVQSMWSTQDSTFYALNENLKKIKAVTGKTPTDIENLKTLRDTAQQQVYLGVFYLLRYKLAQYKELKEKKGNAITADFLEETGEAAGIAEPSSSHSIAANFSYARSLFPNHHDFVLASNDPPPLLSPISGVDHTVSSSSLLESSNPSASSGFGSSDFASGYSSSLETKEKNSISSDACRYPFDLEEISANINELLSHPFHSSSANAKTGSDSSSSLETKEKNSISSNAHHYPFDLEEISANISELLSYPFHSSSAKPKKRNRGANQNSADSARDSEESSSSAKPKKQSKVANQKLFARPMAEITAIFKKEIAGENKDRAKRLKKLLAKQLKGALKTVSTAENGVASGESASIELFARPMAEITAIFKKEIAGENKDRAKRLKKLLAEQLKGALKTVSTAENEASSDKIDIDT